MNPLVIIGPFRHEYILADTPTIQIHLQQTAGAHIESCFLNRVFSRKDFTKPRRRSRLGNCGFYGVPGIQIIRGRRNPIGLPVPVFQQAHGPECRLRNNGIALFIPDLYLPVAVLPGS